MLFKSRRAQDMLEQKKKSLNTYTAQFNTAVSAVTGIIDTLTQTSSNIEQTIAEINEYQKELDATTKGLRETKDKNDKVIKNFRALLAD